MRSIGCHGESDVKVPSKSGDATKVCPASANERRSPSLDNAADHAMLMVVAPSCSHLFARDDSLPRLQTCALLCGSGVDIGLQTVCRQAFIELNVGCDG